MMLTRLDVVVLYHNHVVGIVVVDNETTADEIALQNRIGGVDVMETMTKMVEMMMTKIKQVAKEDVTSF